MNTGETFRTAIVVVSAFVLALSAPAAAAGLGVGVDVGKIEVEEGLTPGSSYRLPVISVKNTGTERSDYEISASYIKGQKELIPPPEWFRFDPDKFNLEPDTVRQVVTTISVPSNAQPGEYFALIEAFPVVSGGAGTTIGIAAATKLRFRVQSGNIAIVALRKLADFMKDASPYSYIAVALVAGLFVARRFFRFKVERKQ